MEPFTDHFKNEALKTPGYSTNGFQPTFTPSSSSSFLQSQTYPGVPQYTYSANSASSFSSASGSVGGASFSSGDALPAISRDFVRPSTSETRRPATAGGALQSRSPFGGFMEQDRGRSSTVAVEDGKPETIDEGTEGLFTDPFASPDKPENLKQMPQIEIQYDGRQEEQFQPLSIQTSWENANSGSLGTPEQPQEQQSSPHNQFPLTSAPPNVTQFNFTLNGAQPQMQLQRPPAINFGARPQTSDGLPSYGNLNAGGVSLPSARTIVNQIDPAAGFNQAYFTPQQNMMPFRDARAASMSEMSQSFPQQFQRHYSIATDKPRPAGYMAKDAAHQELTFVPLGGPAPKKRPRRRYDEIERLYLCGWSGCEKAYGTLNHLNAHVAMQKHGEKRLPTGKHPSSISDRSDPPQNSKTCASSGGRRSANKPRQSPTPSTCLPTPTGKPLADHLSRARATLIDVIRSLRYSPPRQITIPAVPSSTLPTILGTRKRMQVGPTLPAPSLAVRTDDMPKVTATE